ncbi:hypothetical protein BOX15_Mlig009826g1, partial [Macrostomum lignano]
HWSDMKNKTYSKLSTTANATSSSMSAIEGLRKRHYIRVVGDEIPQPEENFDSMFSSLGLPTKLLHNITVRLQYQEPTPIQMQCVPVLMQSRNVLAYAPTGSGKSLAYLLPIVAKTWIDQSNLVADNASGARNKPAALVLLPTVDLAKQVVHSAKQLVQGLPDYRVRLLTSDIDGDSGQTAAVEQVRSADMLVSTPQRLVHLLTAGGPLQAEGLDSVRYLVLDEADRLLRDEGPRGFADQLGAICSRCGHPQLSRALLSATAHPAVEQFCRENFDRLAIVRVGPKQAATNTIDQKLVFCSNEAGKAHEIKTMFARGDLQYPLLIFVHTRQRASELCQLLRDQGLQVDSVTAGRPQETRDKLLRKFREGRLPALVSTDLMARGMDFPSVAMVINYDLPTASREYIHRIGRCGRAGRRGLAVSLWEKRDLPNLRPVLAVMKNSGCQVNPDLYALLPSNSNRRRPPRQQQQQSGNKQAKHKKQSEQAQESARSKAEQAAGRGHVFGGVRAVNRKRRDVRDAKKARRKIRKAKAKARAKEAVSA